MRTRREICGHKARAVSGVNTGESRGLEIMGSRGHDNEEVIKRHGGDLG